MKRNVFSMNNGVKTLVFTDVDEQGNIVFSKDYSSITVLETHSTFDNKNQLLQEINLEEGIEVSKNIYTYDQEGRIIKHALLINGELVEEVITNYTSTGHDETTIENGVTTAKWIYKEVNELTTVTEHYDGTQLIEVFTSVFDPTSKTYETTIVDGNNNLILSRMEKVGDDDLLIELIETDHNGNLLYSVNYEFEGKYIIKAFFKDNRQEALEEVHEYTYNENKNVTLLLITNGKGSKIAYHAKVYDVDQLLIEESGVRGNKIVPIHVPYADPANIDFHFVHEYEE